MEMGMGFMLGLLAGSVVAIITAVVIVVAKRALSKDTPQKNREMQEMAEAAGMADAPGHPTRVIQRPSQVASSRSATRPGIRPGSAATRPAAKTGTRPGTRPVEIAERKERTGNTMIVEEVENRDKQFAESVQEIRDMLLKLADMISSTETASGQAADAFNSAKNTVHNLKSSQSAELQEAQRLLLGEIDRVLATNAALHSELDRANKGIAEQRRQIEELRVQARVDGLTRIPNRAAFDERLSEYISLLERTALTFSLLLVDVDHFKKVNDDHGHINGDRILRGIAAKVSDSIRNNDFAARYGGEEFAVIFPGTDAEEALTVAERVRSDIAKTNFRMDQNTLKMSVSGGLAQCRPGMSPDQIIAAADKALYEAKHSGRNRIFINPEP